MAGLCWGASQTSRLINPADNPLKDPEILSKGWGPPLLVLPKLAQQLGALRQQRAELAHEVEQRVGQRVGQHPLTPVLMSMPGVGIRTTARLLTEVTPPFASAAYLAAYAGLAPVTRRSGGPIRGERLSRRGNKILKRTMFLSAFAALRDPVSRAYYDRKISQGKRHNQAHIALARRRSDVLYAMLRDGAFYHVAPTTNA